MIEQKSLPFISQYSALPSEWGSRGCGLVALKIALDYFHELDNNNQTMPLPQLLETALSSGAYREGIGWSHSGLVHLALGLGYHSWNRDLPKEQAGVTLEQAMNVLKEDVLHGPVLVSVWKSFDPSQKGGHIVVVYKILDGLVSFVDPEKDNEVEGRIEMSAERFAQGFKMRSICLLPK